MLNQVVLIGRLTHDPELRYTAGSGVPVTNFQLAVDRPFTNQQGERDTDFIRIVVWRKQAENCANYLKKGRLAAITGRLQVRSYEDNEGVNRKVVEVVADNVKFLERPRSSDDSSAPGPESTETEGFDEVSGDDVPF